MIEPIFHILSDRSTIVKVDALESLEIFKTLVYTNPTPMRLFDKEWGEEVWPDTSSIYSGD